MPVRGERPSSGESGERKPNNNGIAKLQLIGKQAVERAEKAKRLVCKNRDYYIAREAAVRRQVNGRHKQLPPGQG